jgi:hypothetical protein
LIDNREAELKKELLMLAFVLAVAGIAWAASDPPQVGETSSLLLTNTARSVTWTVQAFRNTSSVNMAGSIVFKNLSATQPGSYIAKTTWPRPGETVLYFTPSNGGYVNKYLVSVQPVGGTAPTAQQIDAQLSSTHGAGSWGSAPGSYTVLPFQGSVSYEMANAGADVHVLRGDSVSIPFSIGKDITGWTVWFAAKAYTTDTDYAVQLREVTASVTDPSTGSGLINLSTTDTDMPPRRYQAELELRKAGSVNTPLRFNLWIDADVIK